MATLGYLVSGLESANHAGGDTAGWARTLFRRVGPARAEPVFRSLTRILHPDNPTTVDTQLQRELNAARAELSNPAKGIRMTNWARLDSFGGPPGTALHVRGEAASVKLNSDGVRAAYYCSAWVCRSLKENRRPIPDWLQSHFDRLDSEVRMSRARQEKRGVEPSSEEEETWIGSPDAAQILGWSKRQVQRHAKELAGQIVGGRWLFRESLVVEFAEGLKHDG